MGDIFKRKFIGLDISDRNIEAVEIDKEGRIVNIEKTSRLRLDDGILERGIIKDAMRLRRAVEHLFNIAQPSRMYAYQVYFALPENQSQVHTFFIRKDPKKTGKFKKAELEKYVNEELGKNIKFDRSELVFSYKVAKEDAVGASVVLVASDRNIISQWHNFFESLEVEVECFDIEPLAILRGLELPDKIKRNEDAAFCLVDFGSSATSVTFFEKDLPFNSFPIAIAGDSLDKEIVEDLHLSKKDAEFQKIQQGLLDKNSQVFYSLSKVLSELKQEIKNAISSFEDEYGRKVKHIIFIGKSSMLKGFLPYMKESFDVEMSFGRPKLLKRYVPIEYVEAVGLALGGIGGKWSKIHPNISLESEYFKESDLEDEKESEKKHYIQTTVIATAFVLIVTVIGSYYINKHKKEEEELAHENHIKEQESMGALSDFSVHTDAEKVIQEATSIEESIKEPKLYIEITETPTGWLNVRSGPGTNFERFSRVDVGESFELLEEGDNWYKIKLDEETEGWVYAEYATTTKE